MITAGVKEALAKLGRAKPFKMAAPYKFELGYHVSAQADMGAMLLPKSRGSDARTLAFTADDYIEGFRTLRALISLALRRDKTRSEKGDTCPRDMSPYNHFIKLNGLFSRISFSMSAISLGTRPDRISLPPSVIRTSSSMRTPMPAYFL